ncbi:hypothetical protein [Nannocystis sp.]|uniref:hypothetical protein n=1 Tax=Nannocystis sp. TaxID=1962667 RepID=UPI0025F6B8E9|nr:hypothetical protein [Nannocystis sp.]MBK7828396.1 hypothetical protein [Nannocystis sp.]
MLAALEKLVSVLRDILAPLPAAIKDPARLRAFLRALGWDADLDAAAIAASPLGALGAAAETTMTVLTAARTVAKTGKADPKTIEAAVEAAIDLFTAIRALAHGGGGAGVLANPAFYRDLAAQLAQHLVLRFLETQHPAVFASLRLVGLIVVDAAAEDPGDPRYADEQRLPHRRYLLNLAGIGGLVDDPLALVRTAWIRDARIDPTIIEVLLQVLMALGVRVRFPPLRPAFLAEHYGIEVPEPEPGEVEDVVVATRELVVPFYTGTSADGEAFIDVGLSLFAEPGGALIAANYGEASMIADVPLGRGWTLQLGWAIDASGALQLRIAPTGLSFAQTLPTLSLGATLDGAPDKPWVFLGTADKPALWLTGWMLGAQLKTHGNDPEVILRFGTPDGGKQGGLGFRLDTTGADGFLAELFANVQLSAEFGVGVTWSSRTGMNLQMSGGFSICVGDGATARPVGPAHRAARPRGP